MVSTRRDEQRAPRRRSGRVRARIAALVGAPLGVLAGAGAAQAQASAPLPPGQPAAEAAVAQAAQAVQTAGAQAAVVQQAPANIAIQIIVNSPGAAPVVNQGQVGQARQRRRGDDGTQGLLAEPPPIPAAHHV